MIISPLIQMTLNKPIVLGICGVARSGKDTLFQFLTKSSPVPLRRFAFADELKKDLDSFLQKKLKIDPFTEDPEDKNIIRPILVAYGEAMRNISKGSFWISKIEPLIKKTLEKNLIPVITDVRYENEVDWINAMPNGLTVHITRDGFTGANKEEELNDPLVREKTSEKIVLQNASDPSILERLFSSAANEISTKYLTG